MSIEAMKQWLEALESAQDNLRPHEDNCFLHDEGEYNRCFCGKDSLSDFLQEQVESLSQAIEQAEKQEPEGYAKQLIEALYENSDPVSVEAAEWIEKSTTQREWVGLTDQEIRDWWRIENGLEDCQLSKLVDFTLAVRAIEAKLKEKNHG